MTKFIWSLVVLTGLAALEVSKKISHALNCEETSITFNPLVMDNGGTYVAKITVSDLMGIVQLKKSFTTVLSMRG